MKTNNRTEQWKSISGFAGRYEVSDKGRVRSMNYNNTGVVRVLKSYLNASTGYMQVSLCDPETGKMIPRNVHRLVAQAFIPNTDNLEQVDHIDGNRQRNVKSNLRWVSRKFNNSRKQARLLRAQNSVKTSHVHQFVKATSKDGEVKYFKSINVASRELGFSHVLGIKVIRGDFKTAKGWKLEYIDRDSPEGMLANVDVRSKRDIRRDLKNELKAKRKARVQEMKLPPRMAHCVMGLDPITQEIAVLYPNAYKAEQDLGIKGIYNAALGMNDRRAGLYIWDFMFA